MNTIHTIARLTFHEAWRRRMVLLALVLGAAFILLFTVGFALITREMRSEGPSEVLIRLLNMNLLLSGLYVVHFLAVMLAIFASVDTISGETASHTIQTLITKPVRRWEVMFGKWLGSAAMLALYLLLLGGGVIGSTYLQSGYLPENALSGFVAAGARSAGAPIAVAAGRHAPLDPDQRRRALHGVWPGLHRRLGRANRFDI